MLLQTNSYIVPPDRRVEHARIVRRFRQTLLRLGCATFEVYEQVGANWSAGESSGRFVQIMRFTDRKQQMAVQQAERHDPAAQAVIAEFCELINFSAQQQQGLFALGFYTSVLSSSTRKLGTDDEETDAGEPVTTIATQPQPAAAVPPPAPMTMAQSQPQPQPQPQPQLEPQPESDRRVSAPTLPVAPLAASNFEDSTATPPVVTAAPAPADDTLPLHPALAEPMDAQAFESMLELDLATDGDTDLESKLPAGTDPDRAFGEEPPAATPFAEAHDPLDPSADFEDLLNVSADSDPAPQASNNHHVDGTPTDDALNLDALDLEASDVEPMADDHTAGHTALGENHNGLPTLELLDDADDTLTDPLPAEHRVQH